MAQRAPWRSGLQAVPGKAGPGSARDAPPQGPRGACRAVAAMCSSLTLMDAPMAGRTDVGAGRTARGAAIGRWLRAARRPERRPRPAGGEGAGSRGLDSSSGKGRRRWKHDSGRNSLPPVRGAGPREGEPGVGRSCPRAAPTLLQARGAQRRDQTREAARAASANSPFPRSQGACRAPRPRLPGLERPWLRPPRPRPPGAAAPRPRVRPARPAPEPPRPRRALLRARAGGRRRRVRARGASGPSPGAQAGVPVGVGARPPACKERKHAREL